jgi:hypothetical protein
MKSFSMFITESRAVFNRAEREKEASERITQAEKFKEESKEKVSKTKQLATQRLASQLKQAKKLKKRTKLQKKLAQQKASQTSQNITQAVQGTAELGKSAIKKIRKVIKNKKQNSTPSP